MPSSNTRSSTTWNSLDLQINASATSVSEHWRTHWEGTALPIKRTLNVQTGPLPPVPQQAKAHTCQLMDRTVPVQVNHNELWIDQGIYLNLNGPVCTVICKDFKPPQDVLALVFTEIHRAGGWLPLHAAVVASQGWAVGISGPSGAGKSTALLQLLEQGVDLVAEDRAFWHAATGQVAGLDQHLRVYQDSLTRFAPAWLPQLSMLNQDVKGKYMLPLPKGTTGQLQQVVLLGETQALAPVARVRAAWELTGVPLSTAGRHIVQAGLPGLVSLIHPVTIARESVVQQVRNVLEKSG